MNYGSLKMNMLELFSKKRISMIPLPIKKEYLMMQNL